MWLPILDITGELEALDLTAELELLDLEAGRADLSAELHALETAFWNTAPRRLEEAVALVSFVEATEAEETGAPESPADLVAPAGPDVSLPAHEPAAPETPAEPATVAPAPAEVVAPAPAGPRTASERVGLRARVSGALAGVDLRTRFVGTLLVVALLGAFATVFPSVVGASVPQRYVTVTLDGRRVARTVRVPTVADVLALESITLRPGDRVVPASRTELREGMHIRVLRSFPVDVEVNGAVTTVRTTVHSPAALRRELGLDRALLALGSSRLAAGTTIAFRTPHNVTLQADGRTITARRSTALDVAALLTEQGVPLGARDEVMPAPNTHLADGLRVQVFRLADNQVAERFAVPFTTEMRDDPNLPVGQARTIQPGAPGLRRDLFQITTRDNGTVVAKDRIGSELLTPPVAQVIVKGTQPIPPQATGSATWYGTAPGRGTCAHLHLPFGTIVTLTNPATGATAQCRVADRGPEAWTGHIIDLAPDVFRRLAPLSQGIVPNLALSY